MRRLVYGFFATLVIGITLMSAATASADDAAAKVRKANRLMQKKSYAEAAGIYREALGERPESPEIAYNLANALYRENRWEESEKTYGQAVKQAEKPLLARSLYNQGNAQVGQGRLQEAIVSYQKAIELNPEDADAKHNLEFVRKKLKEMLENAKMTQNAIEQMKEAQQSSGESPDESNESSKSNGSAEPADSAELAEAGESSKEAQATAGEKSGEKQDEGKEAVAGAKEAGSDESKNKEGELKDLKASGQKPGDSEKDKKESGGTAAESTPSSKEARKESAASERGLDAFERRQDRWLLPQEKSDRTRGARVERDW